MIAVLTDPGIGGTFLSWTIYFLSGKTQYFSVRAKGLIKLPDNILTSKNAHNFIPNQPRTLEEFNSFLPLVKQHDECMYMHQFRSDTKDAVTPLVSCATKIVVLPLSHNQVLYQCSYASRSGVVPLWNSDRKLTNDDEIYEDFVTHFFKDSSIAWEQENLNNVWDKREFIALNFRPFSNDSILNYVDSAALYYHINPMDLWTTFDHSVIQLFTYLGIVVNEIRYRQWLPIYYEWKKLHINRIKFIWYFDTIVDYIQQGVDFDLTSFNLDICQEAAIQHWLIYKHNLNFKTWELVKFTNTKQLHSLLEPNIHPVPLIY